MLRFLLSSGIEAARGVALNGTHYSSTADEVARGAAIVQALESRGITGKKVVVNTSSNGRPFEFGRYDGPDAENARVLHVAGRHPAVRDPRDPAHGRRRQPRMGASRGDERAGRSVRRRLPVVRPTLALQAG